MLSAFGSYQTYLYSESTTFCGAVCHSAMNPEFTTYQRGAHARVACVECHVGPGASAFINAKINGTHQLIAFTLNNYHRPIDTPVKNLRPARDTCEKCHWPQKFDGNVDVAFDHYLSDKKNTAYTVRLLLHVNSGHPGSPIGGIHWHVSPDSKVEYYATDEKRQQIAWMRVTNRKDGSVREYRTDAFKGEPPAAAIREMDCIDCHNRPAHKFPTANEAVERSMALGTLSTNLPFIKRNAVAAMLQKDITTSAAAPQKIADFLTSKYKGRPELAGCDHRGAAHLFAEHFPRAKGRLARLSEQYWAQGLARLLPLPRQPAQDRLRRDGAVERLHLVPRNHSAGQGRRSGLHEPDGPRIQAPGR